VGFPCGRGHNARWSSRAIEPTSSKASPGLTQTAIVIGHKAQIGSWSMASPFFMRFDLLAGSLTGGSRRSDRERALMQRAA
jgi:hypothetical protein